MENLSQEEIDALLEEASEDPGASAAGSREGEERGDDDPAIPEGEAAGAVRSFDFNRPNNLSRGFERTVRGICENYAKIATLGFSNHLRANCVFTFGGLKPTSFGEAFAGVENPSCIGVITCAPLKGPVLLTVEVGLMFSFFTKLLGGPIEEVTQLRDFTEIEMGMARKILDRVLGYLRDASEKIVSLTPVLSQIENNPNYLNVLSDGEAVLDLQYSVTMDSVGGSVNFCMPLAAFEPVREKLDPKQGMDLRNAADSRRERETMERVLRETTARVSAVFSPQSVSVQELARLAPGRTLSLTHPVSRPLTVLVEGRPMFEGVAGRAGQARAVRILRRRKES